MHSPKTGKSEQVTRHSTRGERKVALRATRRARRRMDRLACQGQEVPTRLTHGWAD